MSCLSQRTVALQKSSSLEEETKSYVGFSFQVSVCCQNYWRSWINKKHNEWNLSHFLSLTVCKFLVNWSLGTDAGVNDVFSVLLALVALSLARSLLRFIISITKKWESYEKRGGLWKKRMRYRLFGKKLMHPLMVNKTVCLICISMFVVPCACSHQNVLTWVC